MALTTKRDKVVYQVLVPLLTTIIGAILAAVFQAVTLDKAQLADITLLIKDAQLTPAQKLQALETYKEITDRPWYIVRTITTMTLVLVPAFVMALVSRGFFDRSQR